LRTHIEDQFTHEIHRHPSLFSNRRKSGQTKLQQRRKASACQRAEAKGVLQGQTGSAYSCNPRFREKRLRCAPANSPCKPSSGSSKTGRNTRFHGPLAVKPGHTSMSPRRKGVGNSSRDCCQRTVFLLGFRHPGRCVPVPYL
jgi:hypothetical protein